MLSFYSFRVTHQLPVVILLLLVTIPLLGDTLLRPGVSHLLLPVLIPELLVAIPPPVTQVTQSYPPLSLALRLFFFFFRWRLSHTAPSAKLRPPGGISRLRRASPSWSARLRSSSSWSTWLRSSSHRICPTSRWIRTASSARIWSTPRGSTRIRSTPWGSTWLCSSTYWPAAATTTSSWTATASRYWNLTL